MLTTTENEVIAWRLSQLESLGFTPDQAVSLAATRVDLHEVAKLIEAGCTPELAARILT